MPDKPSTDSETQASTDAVTSTWKVLGKLKNSAATGILGRNTSTTGQTTGVEGLSDSSGNGSAGVRGTATASNGTVFGVKGVTQSSDWRSAALDGYSPNGGTGLVAIADKEFGGWVYTNEANRTGVYGANEASTGSGTGVYGYTLSTDNDAEGVFGVDNAGSGETYGVRGQTSSDNAMAAGVLGESFGSNSPAVKAKGHVDIGESGSSVYLGSNQTVANDDNEHRILFDTIESEDLSGFDTTNNEYVCSVPGDYQVEVNVVWLDTLSSGTQPVARIKTDRSGSVRAEAANFQTVPSDTGDVTHSFSKTLKGLSAGDKIFATMDHDDTGGDKRLNGGFLSFTYMVVTKVA